ncbi:GerMN domain-containing protein [Nonomuraea fuscirosea]|uniref:GerMN domain-containing protein n=1 Tax=Nonomuraea fuscirosea TaxID=1291556 RepID=UPI0033CA3BF1
MIAVVNTALVAVAVSAGCGISDTEALPAGQPVRGGLTADSGSLLRVYFVTPQGTWPVSRPAAAGDRLQQAMDALLSGPTAEERARGLGTKLPTADRKLRATARRDGVELHLPWLVRDLPHVAVSQLVCTAAAVPGVGEDAVVRVFEPGMGNTPWLVECDGNGSAKPSAQKGSTNRPTGEGSGSVGPADGPAGPAGQADRAVGSAGRIAGPFGQADGSGSLAGKVANSAGRAGGMAGSVGRVVGSLGRGGVL